MISAADIVGQVRRALLIQFAGYVGAAAVLGFVVARNAEYGSFTTNFFTVFVLAVCFAIIVAYPGKYVPTMSKHETLLSRYGDVYLAEAERAIAKYGLNQMLSTQWFKSYADDFCQRRSALGDV